MNETLPLRIDIVSDVVCPWCVIGYKQLERALDETGLAAEIRWHPFELNPAMPAEGQNLREHMAEKYGTTREGSQKARARLTAMGAELGFSFDYADDMRMVNTFQAHQLIHWAAEQGRAHDLKMALFEAYFGQREDVSDPETLVAVAVSIGLDGGAARAALADGSHQDTVRQEERYFLERGVQGVPAMIFQDRYILSGAQGAENYAIVLRQLAGEPNT